MKVENVGRREQKDERETSNNRKATKITKEFSSDAF